MVSVIVCGSREWDDRKFLWETLDRFVELNGEFVLIHGAAKGADLMAEEWAKAREFRYRGFPARWRTLYKAAGPLRNTEMIEVDGVVAVLAFKDGFDFTLARGGTENMVKQAKQFDVPVQVYQHDEAEQTRQRRAKEVMACRCDGRGILPGRDGLVVGCPDCKERRERWSREDENG